MGERKIVKLKVFTLRMNPSSGTFDDKELSDFQLGKDILEVSEHFLIHEKTPTLVLVLRYRELPDSARPPSSEESRKDWRAELDGEGQKIYDELRLWRSRKAKREGMPPHLIFNNRELSELAMKHPETLTQLRQIQGIGEAKSQRWGEEILSLMAKLVQHKPAEHPSQAPINPQKEGGG